MDKNTNKNMEYRKLGPTGIKVSVIGYGTWINAKTPDAKKNTI
jgi:aryl-alcohol dehydrogenase-like predicted oxidoreductase